MTVQAHQNCWKQRRAMLLQKACCGVSKLTGRGVPVWVAVERVANRFDGRPLGNSKILHCSSNSLCRFFYHWKKAGCTPEAFSLRHKPGRKIDARRITALIREALNANVSISKIYRLCGGQGRLHFTINSLHRRVDKRIVKVARVYEQLARMKCSIIAQLDGFVTDETK